MSNRFRSAVMSACAAASAVALALSGASSAAAATYADQDLVNRSDGGRLALYGNGTGEGAHAIALRAPAYKYSTEAWDAVQAGAGGSTGFVLKNQAANKCLQPNTGTPARGMRIVVRTCDGSALQTWSLKPGTVGMAHTGWWMWRPLVKQDLAMAVDRYSDGTWSSLHLDTAYPSSDRLWQLSPNDTAW
ncbi:MULTISPECIES: RICIN domain-containing protein [Streptomyces]|uniref:RICIN domain-containing protein n=1 Tax=Streptomyces TaxID=1883 RepID=UPI00039AEFA9|nr:MULTISPECIES: hypothetical protein [Streptomyces]